MARYLHTSTMQRRQRLRSPEAAATSFVLSQIARASGVDYAVVIPVGGALLMLYWIANFVVPELAIPKPGGPQSEEGSDTTGVLESSKTSSSNPREERETKSKNV